MCCLSCLTDLKDASLRDWPCSIENPDFHLVEPGSPGRGEMKPYGWMALEPGIVFGLVRVEVVEDDMDGAVRMSGDDVVINQGIQRRRRVLCEVVTLPVATSTAARCRCACSRVEGFSSTQMTTAFSGGAMYADHVGGLGRCFARTSAGSDARSRCRAGRSGCSRGAPARRASPAKAGAGLPHRRP